MNNLYFGNKPQLISETIIERARKLTSTLLADAMGCTGAMDYTIKPVAKGMKMVGTALTVKMRAGDNLFLHKAITIGEPGYILVADGKGHTGNAYLGELMAEAAKFNQVEGIVIDGAVRDQDALIELDLPIFAKGFSPNGPHKDGPGEINTPISCGGVTVQAGDLVFADNDGVVIVPMVKIEKVLGLAEEKLEYENKRKFEIRSGIVEPSWLKLKLAIYEK